MAPVTHPYGLPPSNNFITANSDSDGLSKFTKSSDSPTVAWKTIPGHQVAFADLHKVTSNPASFSNDLAETESQVLDNFKVGSVPYVGALFQRIDVPPGSVTPMHRMLTLGYGVIASGEAELVLDSGDIRVVKQGDTVVERASMHQWKNLSRTEWLRVIWVLIPILPVEVGGKKLEEEFKG